jgi:hypothetical protein
VARSRSGVVSCEGVGKARFLSPGKKLEELLTPAESFVVELEYPTVISVFRSDAMAVT